MNEGLLNCVELIVFGEGFHFEFLHVFFNCEFLHALVDVLLHFVLELLVLLHEPQDGVGALAYRIVLGVVEDLGVRQEEVVLDLLAVDGLLELVLILGVLSRDMGENIIEDALVIQDELVYDGPVDVFAREFILIPVLINILGHVTEILGDLGSILVQNLAVIPVHLHQKLCVVLDLPI